jgi:excisionase family DNA binding protein
VRLFNQNQHTVGYSIRAIQFEYLEATPEMKPLELSLRVTIDDAGVQAIVDVIRQALRVDGEVDALGEARMRASRNALFAGQKPPEDRGLLIDTNQVAKLLKVSARTVWRMEHSGEMPKAIRIGKAVRWGYDEINAWVGAGCPSAEQWKSQRQHTMPKQAAKVPER